MAKLTSGVGGGSVGGGGGGGGGGNSDSGDPLKNSSNTDAEGLSPEEAARRARKSKKGTKENPSPDKVGDPISRTVKSGDDIAKSATTTKKVKKIKKAQRETSDPVPSDRPQIEKQADALEGRVANKKPGLSKQDVTVVRKDNQLVARLSEGGQRQRLRQRRRMLENRAKAVSQQREKFDVDDVDTSVGVEERTATLPAKARAVRRTARSGEVFGDFDYPGDAEKRLRDLSSAAEKPIQAFQQDVERQLQREVGRDRQRTQSLTEAERANQLDLFESAINDEETTRAEAQTLEGVFDTVSGAANLPQVAVGGLETIETAAFAAENTAGALQGDPRDREELERLGVRTALVAAEGAEYVLTNPNQAAGNVLGGLGLSLGTSAAASAASKAVGIGGVEVDSRIPAELDPRVSLAGKAVSKAREIDSDTLGDVRARARRELVSARFKAAELRSRDAPTRTPGSESGDTTDSSFGNRVRQEAVSARFKAGEVAEDIREKSELARERLVPDDERGSVQPQKLLPKHRQKPDSDGGTDGPKQRRQRAEESKATVDDGGRVAGGRVGAALAADTNVTGAGDIDTAVRDRARVADRSAQALGVDVGADREALGRTDVSTDTDALGRTDLDTDTEQDTGQDVNRFLRTDSDVDTQSDRDRKRDRDRDLDLDGDLEDEGPDRNPGFGTADYTFSYDVDPTVILSGKPLRGGDTADMDRATTDTKDFDDLL